MGRREERGGVGMGAQTEKLIRKFASGLLPAGSQLANPGGVGPSVELREAQLIPTRVIDSLIISESVYKMLFPFALRAGSSLSLPSPLGGAGVRLVVGVWPKPAPGKLGFTRRLQTPVPGSLASPGSGSAQALRGGPSRSHGYRIPGLNL